MKFAANNQQNNQQHAQHQYYKLSLTTVIT